MSNCTLNPNSLSAPSSENSQTNFHKTQKIETEFDNLVLSYKNDKGEKEIIPLHEQRKIFAGLSMLKIKLLTGEVESNGKALNLLDIAEKEPVKSEIIAEQLLTGKQPTDSERINMAANVVVYAQLNNLAKKAETNKEKQVLEALLDDHKKFNAIMDDYMRRNKLDKIYNEARKNAVNDDIEHWQMNLGEYDVFNSASARMEWLLRSIPRFLVNDKATTKEVQFITNAQGQPLVERVYGITQYQNPREVKSYLNNVLSGSKDFHEVMDRLQNLEQKGDPLAATIRDWLNVQQQNIKEQNKKAKVSEQTLNEFFRLFNLEQYSYVEIYRDEDNKILIETVNENNFSKKIRKRIENSWINAFTELPKDGDSRVLKRDPNNKTFLARQAKKVLEMLENLSKERALKSPIRRLDKEKLDIIKDIITDENNNIEVYAKLGIEISWKEFLTLISHIQDGNNYGAYQTGTEERSISSNSSVADLFGEKSPLYFIANSFLNAGNKNIKDPVKLFQNNRNDLLQVLLPKEIEDRGKSGSVVRSGGDSYWKYSYGTYLTKGLKKFLKQTKNKGTKIGQWFKDSELTAVLSYKLSNKGDAKKGMNLNTRQKLQTKAGNIFSAYRSGKGLNNPAKAIFEAYVLSDKEREYSHKMKALPIVENDTITTEPIEDILTENTKQELTDINATLSYLKKLIKTTDPNEIRSIKAKLTKGLHFSGHEALNKIGALDFSKLTEEEKGFKIVEIIESAAGAFFHGQSYFSQDLLRAYYEVTPLGNNPDSNSKMFDFDPETFEVSFKESFTENNDQKLRSTLRAKIISPEVDSVLEHFKDLGVDIAKVDPAVTSNIKKSLKLSDDKVNRVLALIYAGNNLAYYSSFTAIYGSPAMKGKFKPTDFKGKEKDFAQALNQLNVNLENTFSNYVKRNAGIAAPYIQLNFKPEDSTINYLIIKDNEIDISNKVKEEFKKLYDIYPDKKEVDKMLKAYEGVEAGDAFEFTSIEEHTRIMVAEGFISSGERQTILDNTKNKDTYTKFLKSKEGRRLMELMVPHKPVYYGENTIQGDNEISSYSRALYVKTSSVPIIPALVEKGSHLEHIVKLFEKGKIDRVVYESGVKSGQSGNVIDINEFNAMTEEEKSEIENTLDDYIVEASREFFGLQFQIPTRKKRSIKLATQPRKLIHGNIPNNEIKDENGNKLTSDEVSGKLHSIENDIFDEQFKQLADEFGFEIREETTLETKIKDGQTIEEEITVEKLYIKDLEKLQRVLIRETESRDLGINAKDLLTLTEDAKAFETPLYLNPQSSKLETALLSVISKRLVEYKIPGSSYVLAPDLELDSLGVKFIGSKKRSELKGNEIVVPHDFFTTENGDTLTLEQIQNNPDKYANMLEIVGYRIPTQGYNSMRALKVVGFLPPAYGHSVITSKELHVAMGSDFDVDKLYLLREENLAKGIGKKKNELLHWYKKILNNEKVKALSLKPDGQGDLGLLAEQKKAEKVASNSTDQPNTATGFTSPVKQQEAKSGALDSKIGVAIMSKIATGYVKVQQAKMALGNAFLGLGNKNIGTPLYQTGKATTKEGQNDLMGKIANVVDTIQHFQSAAVDNVKEQILQYINANNDTFNTLFTLTYIGLSEQQIVDILTNPLLEEYLKFKQKEFKFSPAQFKKFLKENNKLHSNKNLVEDFAQGISLDLFTNPGLNGFADTLEKTKFDELNSLEINKVTGEPDTIQREYNLLAVFLAAQQYSASINKVLNTTEVDTNSLGKNFNGALKKVNGDSFPENIKFNKKNTSLLTIKAGDNVINTVYKTIIDNSNKVLKLLTSPSLNLTLTGHYGYQRVAESLEALGVPVNHIEKLESDLTSLAITDNKLLFPNGATSERIRLTKQSETSRQNMPKKVNIAFQPDNLNKIKNGTKTSTVRSSKQVSQIGLKPKESGLITVNNQEYLVTFIGNITVDEIGGKDKAWKTEGFTENAGPKYQQTKEWLEGKRKLGYYTISPYYNTSENIKDKNIVEQVGYLRDTYPELANNLIIDGLIGEYDVKTNSYYFSFDKGDTTLTSDDYTLSWLELLDHPNGEISSFAEDLVKYAFLSGTKEYMFNNLFQYVPQKWVNNKYNVNNQVPATIKRMLEDDSANVISQIALNYKVVPDLNDDLSSDIEVTEKEANKKNNIRQKILDKLGNKNLSRSTYDINVPVDKAVSSEITTLINNKNTDLSLLEYPAVGEINLPYNNILESPDLDTVLEFINEKGDRFQEANAGILAMYYHSEENKANAPTIKLVTDGSMIGSQEAQYDPSANTISINVNAYNKLTQSEKVAALLEEYNHAMTITTQQDLTSDQKEAGKEIYKAGVAKILKVIKDLTTTVRGNKGEILRVNLLEHLEFKSVSDAKKLVKEYVEKIRNGEFDPNSPEATKYSALSKEFELYNEKTTLFHLLYPLINQEEFMARGIRGGAFTKLLADTKISKPLFKRVFDYLSKAFKEVFGKWVNKYFPEQDLTDTLYSDIVAVMFNHAQSTSRPYNEALKELPIAYSIAAPNMKFANNANQWAAKWTSDNKKKNKVSIKDFFKRAIPKRKEKVKRTEFNKKERLILTLEQKAKAFDDLAIKGNKKAEKRAQELKQEAEEIRLGVQYKKTVEVMGNEINRMQNALKEPLSLEKYDEINNFVDLFLGVLNSDEFNSQDFNSENAPDLDTVQSHLARLTLIQNQVNNKIQKELYTVFNNFLESKGQSIDALPEDVKSKYFDTNLKKIKLENVDADNIFRGNMVNIGKSKNLLSQFADAIGEEAIANLNTSTIRLEKLYKQKEKEALEELSKLDGFEGTKEELKDLITNKQFSFSTVEENGVTRIKRDKDGKPIITEGKHRKIRHGISPELQAELYDLTLLLKNAKGNEYFKYLQEYASKITDNFELVSKDHPIAKNNQKLFEKKKNELSYLAKEDPEAYREWVNRNDPQIFRYLFNEIKKGNSDPDILSAFTELRNFDLIALKPKNPDNKLAIVLNNKKLKEFYQFYTQSQREAYEKLPGIRNEEGKRVNPRNILAVDENFVKSLKGDKGKAVGKAISKYLVPKLGSRSGVSSDYLDPFTGEHKGQIPVVESKEKDGTSEDLKTSLLALSQSSFNYEAKSQLEPLYNTLINQLKYASSIGAYGANDLSHTIKALQYHKDVILYSKNKNEKEGVTDQGFFSEDEQSEINRLNNKIAELDAEIATLEKSSNNEAAILDLKKKRESLVNEYMNVGKVVNLASIGDYLIRFSRRNGLFFNIKSAFVDVVYGTISNFTFAREGKFSHKDLGEAYKELFVTSRQKWKRLQEIRKFMQIETDYTEENFTSDNNDLDKVGYWFTSLSGGTNAMTLAIAMLKNKKHESGDSYWDVLMNSDEITTDSKIVNKDGSLKPEFVALGAEMNNEIRSIHGNYSQNKPINIKKGVIGRTMMMFKSWLPNALEKRFGSERYDIAANERQIGIYRAIGEIIQAKAEGRPIPDHIVHLQKVILADMVVVTSLALMAYALTAADDDEDKNTALVNMLNRLANDASLYSNPMNLTHLAKEPFATTRTIENVLGLGKEFVTMMFTAPFGAYEWEYERGRTSGENKLFKKTTDLIPFYNGLESSARAFYEKDQQR